MLKRLQSSTVSRFFYSFYQNVRTVFFILSVYFSKAEALNVILSPFPFEKKNKKLNSLTNYGSAFFVLIQELLKSLFGIYISRYIFFPDISAIT